MDKQGTAISLCVRGQEKMLKRIEQFTHTKLYRQSIPGIAEILEQSDDDMELEDVHDRGPARKRFNERRRSGHKGAGNSKKFQDRDNESTETSVPVEHTEPAVDLAPTEHVELKEYVVSTESIQDDKIIRKTERNMHKMEISLRTELTEPGEQRENRGRSSRSGRSEHNNRGFGGRSDHGGSRDHGSHGGSRDYAGHGRRDQGANGGSRNFGGSGPRVQREHTEHRAPSEHRSSAEHHVSSEQPASRFFTEHPKRSEKKRAPKVNSTPKRRREALVK
jgi:hypothetical protein